MEWLPTFSDEVVNVAWALPLSVPVPMTIAPSLNVTVPVGAAPVTVAVKITDCPKALGFSEEVTTVVVALFLAFLPPVVVLQILGSRSGTPELLPASPADP